MSGLTEDEIDLLLEEEAEAELEAEAEAELEAEADAELVEELKEEVEVGKKRIQPPRLTSEEKETLPVLPVYELVKEYVAAALTEAFNTDDPELKFLLPEDMDLEQAIESYTNLVTSSLRYGTTYTRPVQRRVDFLINYLADSM